MKVAALASVPNQYKVQSFALYLTIIFIMMAIQEFPLVVFIEKEILVKVQLTGSNYFLNQKYGTLLSSFF